ncbi:MAG: ZIP family metal transporter [Bacteroidetes bacterium]|nr:ZIP family metal transporter [Bacteroidota bacterium]
MGILEMLLLFTSVFFAGILFFVFKKSNPLYLKLALAFTGSFLFALSMVHLLPGVFKSESENIGYFILLGFFIQLILEYFSEGIEHGHIHVHKHHNHSFPLAMMAGLCIHSFLEGMPLAGKFDHDHHSHSLLTGLLLHHLPVAFALVSMLSASGMSRAYTILNLVIFAAMAPLGAVASEILGHTELMHISTYYYQIMAVVIGIFLHISTTILFESGSDHRFNLYKMVIIILGALLALLQ